MKIGKIKSCLLFLFGSVIFLSYKVLAQSDIHFSQFYESSILRNPALTGVFSDNYKIAAYYRSQWSTITNPYQTALVDLEYRLIISGLSNDFLSFGLLGYNDQAGDLNQKITGLYPAINYNKSLNQNNNSYLSIGFVSGYLQYSFDPSKATFNNQFQNNIFSPANPTFENIPNPKMNLFDIGAGINFNFSPGSEKEATYMIGASGYHFSHPVFSYFHNGALPQDIRLNINAGLIYNLSDNFIFQIHGNYANQGPYQEIMTGGLMGWHTYSANLDPAFEIYAGLVYRYSDAIIPVLKLKYKTLAVGVSYDVNNSTLKEASNMQGGLEMTLSLTGNYPKNPGAYKNTVCPRF